MICSLFRLVHVWHDLFVMAMWWLPPAPRDLAGAGALVSSCCAPAVRRTKARPHLPQNLTDPAMAPSAVGIQGCSVLSECWQYHVALCGRMLRCRCFKTGCPCQGNARLNLASAGCFILHICGIASAHWLHGCSPPPSFCCCRCLQVRCPNQAIPEPAWEAHPVSVCPSMA